jgi:rhodanese-related sulfurtransferase
MGPLVPDLITDELNLLVALFLGFGFGFILEQAGFSSSRRLTGLFYGIDFTVLRVFFTAGVTAMIGVALLGGLGLLDLSLVYVNPTFVTSALVGGAIMGVGFVIGGYCPGTSFCGAAVGRVDAMLFVLGGLLGVFGFGEAFPRLQGLYTARSLGDVTLPTALGVSPGAVVVAAAVVAIAAFVVTGRIERRVNPRSSITRFPAWPRRLDAAALLAAAALVAWLGQPEARLLARVSDAAFRQAHPVRRVSADEVAFRILDGDERLRLIDTRSATQFASFSLPRAVSLPLADLFGRGAREPLSPARDLKVFFGEDEGEATTAALLAIALGYDNVAVLQGGLREFRADFLAGPGATGPSAGSGDETAAFRADAAPRIASLIRERGAARPAKAKVKKVAGGCGV